jgi:hypothetical protein
VRQRTTARPPQDRPRPSRSRIRRAAIPVAGLVSLTLVAAACGGGSPSASQATTPATAGGASNPGAGPVTRPGSSARSGSSGNESTGTYSAAFAECMRAHGVPRFPKPDGSEGQLGPDSGVNPAAPAFRAAMNGPCKSLAPAAWVSSGQVTAGGGS